MMGEKESDIQPRDKIEEENSGDERILGRDQVNDEQTDAGDRLSKAQPMRPQQFIAPKGILGAAQRLESHAQDEDAAVNAVTPPGEIFDSRRVKRDHDPYAKPEQQSDDQDLAKYEEAV